MKHVVPHPIKMKEHRSLNTVISRTVSFFNIASTSHVLYQYLLHCNNEKTIQNYDEVYLQQNKLKQNLLFVRMWTD
jgi:hypothetical protein